ncbi:MAG: hypothetical protein AAF960_15715 [Bacteroidota bacterium]
MKEEDSKVKISKSAFTEWLEKLQQESWQLELLISGFALFAIWEARVLVDGFEEYLTVYRGNGYFSGIFFRSFAYLLTIGWRIFFFNLLIHVLARGLWIGAIGLRYVSSEIDYDYFDYADNFTKFLKKQVGDFDDYIEQLERFSSVLFAYTFLLFFIFLSLILYFVEVMFITYLFDDQNLGGMFILMALFLGLIAFIDFVTMGGVKKIKEKSIAKIYFVFYRIFSVMTLSFFYRPLLYNFWDEKYTRRLFLVSIPYILLLTLVPKIESEAYPFFPVYHHGSTHEMTTYEPVFYDDERQLDYERRGGIFRKHPAIHRISLPSVELSGNYGRFFLRTYSSDAKWLKETQQIPPFKQEGVSFNGWGEEFKDPEFVKMDSLESAAVSAFFGRRRTLRKQLKKGETVDDLTGLKELNGELVIDEPYWEEKGDSIRAYWWKVKKEYELEKLANLKNGILSLAEIRIDDQVYTDSCECKFYTHPNLGEKGLRCYFPMKNLAEGEHLLHLKRRLFSGRKFDKEEVADYYVPFYKIDRE